MTTTMQTVLEPRVATMKRTRVATMKPPALDATHGDDEAEGARAEHGDDEVAGAGGRAWGR